MCKSDLHEKYIIRHKILEYLIIKLDEYAPEDAGKYLNVTKTNIRDVATSIQYPYREVYKYHHIMHYNDPQIRCEASQNNKHHFIILEEAGLAAYADEYWLNMGRKEKLEENSIKASLTVNRLIWFTFLIAVSSVAFQALTYFNDSGKHDLVQQLQSRDTLILSLKSKLLQIENAQRHTTSGKNPSKNALHDSTQ